MTDTLQQQLLEAAKRGNAQDAQRLIEAGADVNARDEEDWTPLQWAALYDHAEVAARLLEAGADSDARNSSGRGALHVAVLNGHASVVQVLLAAGANLALKDRDGATPEDLARDFWEPALAELLRAAAQRQTAAERTTPVFPARSRRGRAL